MTNSTKSAFWHETSPHVLILKQLLDHAGSPFVDNGGDKIADKLRTHAVGVINNIDSSVLYFLSLHIGGNEVDKSVDHENYLSNT